MKTLDLKRPMPFMITTALIGPAALGGSLVMAVMIAAQDAEVQMNWTFGYWTLAILGVIAFCLVMRLAYLAETYIWEYLALCKLLKKKGLGAWVIEAQAIRSLK